MAAGEQGDKTTGGTSSIQQGEELKMMEMVRRETSHWWWFDSHSTSKRSPWLRSTLSDLDKKTKAMLKLIEEDADSFAQRAEMYYKKRPELISMVEDFYRAHRSLAERYDQLKSDSGNRLITTLSSPFSAKYQSEKSVTDQTFDSQSDTQDHEDCAESEVDDPELEDETQIDEDMEEVEGSELGKESLIYEDVEEESHAVFNDEVPKLREEIERLKEENRIQKEESHAVFNDEIAKLREEVERLKEENMIQKDELLQKDEEKREVIRQLSVAIEVLKLENMDLKKLVARDSPKKGSRFEFEKLKDVFLGKLFNGSANSQGSVVAI